jgi:O-acetyl-ADP-ribose deacetylase (regulator of RNase III)
MSITIINGDLLQDGGIIVHQVNCNTSVGKGLSEHVFRKYPYANVYNDGTVRTPGTIIVRHNVVNLVGQCKPGKPNSTETAAQREIWFWSALNQLGPMLKQHNIQTVAFPYGIGCGLAGGNWDHYYNMICQFATTYGIHVKIYNLSN